jgi:hypothetical protein
MALTHNLMILIFIEVFYRAVLTPFSPYKFLFDRIREIYPGFNIGESTGKKGDWANLWRHPFRHWKFVPATFDIDEDRAKPKK